MSRKERRAALAERPAAPQASLSDTPPDQAEYLPPVSADADWTPVLPILRALQSAASHSHDAHKVAVCLLELRGHLVGAAATVDSPSAAWLLRLHKDLADGA
jgi:hypothetical protein